MSSNRRFIVSLWVLTLLSAATLTVSEYLYDATAATISFLNSLVLIVFSTVGLLCRGKRMPVVLKLAVQTLMGLCLLWFVWSLLFGGAQGAMGRAFRMGHLALLIMSCRYLLIRGNKDYAQLFLLSLLLMIIAAITSGTIVIAPFYVVYLLLGVYCLILFQLQRQIEMISATRFVGVMPDKSDLDRHRAELSSFWRQLGPVRFKVTCGVILFLSLCFSIAVFILFPRLEAGTLLGTTFGSRSTSGFSDSVQLGSIDKNETLKQVIARVAVSQNGRSIATAGRPLYLRCVSLDTYSSSEAIEGRYTWSRSFMNYFLNRPLSREALEPGHGLIEQGILLNPINSMYLPGQYPIVQVEGLDNEQLVCSRLDNAVSRRYYRGQEPIDYRVGSQSHFPAEKVMERFEENMPHLVNMLPNMRLNRIILSNDVHTLASDIVKDLAVQRALLKRDQDDLVREWLDYRSPTFAINPFGFGRFNLHRDKDPALASDEVYRDITQDLFNVSSQMGQLDRQIGHLIVAYLRDQYVYTVEAPEFPELDEEDEEDEERAFDPVDRFLKHEIKGGNCEYFASAMVQLCRSLNMAARLAVGYLAWDYLEEHDYYLVRQRDAHCWVEIYTADEGWVRFDPTPLAATQTQETGLLAGLFSQLSNVFERIQFSWLKFSASEKGQESLNWANTITSWVEELDQEGIAKVEKLSFFKLWFTHHEGESYFYLFLRWIIFFLFLIDVGIGIKVLITWVIPWYLQWRKHKQHIRAYAPSEYVFYREMLELLQGLQIHKAQHQTSREFALAVMDYSKDFGPVGFISEMYYRLRFGGESLDEKNQASLDKALERLGLFALSLKKTSKRPWPWEEQE